jgi:hypothetical protein
MSDGLRVRRTRVSARSIQIALGVVWLLDGLLQLQPKMFGLDFAHQVILPNASGQPGFIASAITHLSHLIAAQPALVDIVFAGVQLLIGAGLLIRQTVKPALVLSFAWALGVWSLGEGFGGLFNHSAMPITGAPGAALLYLVIGLLVWPRQGEVVGTGSAAGEGLLGELVGRVVWVVLWCGLGIMWFLPSSSGNGALPGMISDAASGEPGWLAHVQLSLAHSVGGGSTVAVAAGLLSMLVGLGPLLFRRFTAYLVIGVALALDFWVVGQALGQMFTGLATDPSTGPLVVLLALAIYPGVPVRIPPPPPAPGPVLATYDTSVLDHEALGTKVMATKVLSGHTS